MFSRLGQVLSRRCAGIVVSVVFAYCGAAESADCRAAAPPKLSTHDIDKLIADTEQLLTHVPRLSERIRFQCAIAYLTLRDKPVEARRRFDEIFAQIDAANAAVENATDSSTVADCVVQHEDRAQVAEWMGRTGLREEARKMLLQYEQKRSSLCNGMVWGHQCEEDVPRFAVLGFDDDAQRMVNRLGEETDLMHRLAATTGMAIEARRNGHHARAERWKQAALEEFGRVKEYRYSNVVSIVGLLTAFEAERELVEVFAQAERGGMKLEELLSLQARYVRMLKASGRLAEARAIVERFEKLPRGEYFASYYCPLLVAIGDYDKASKENRERAMQTTYCPGDEKYRRHAVSRCARNLAMQAFGFGDIPAAKRFYREYVEYRNEEPLRDFHGSSGEEFEFFRNQRFEDAAFAVECGDVGALMKLAKEEPLVDRHHAEFLCRCYLATAMELEPPHDLAPPNPFLNKYWSKGGRVRL